MCCRLVQLSTVWSDDFGYILGPALSSYESERVTGQTYGNDEFQQAIKRTVPHNCVFKGVPFQFTSLNPSIVFASLLNSRALVDLLTSDGSDLRFGIRVKVIVYPEDYVACWLMIATIKKAEDFLSAPMPMYQ
jgi:centrosomal protein CEP76